MLLNFERLLPRFEAGTSGSDPAPGWRYPRLPSCRIGPFAHSLFYLLVSGCGAAPTPTGMIPGTYSGTIFCDISIEDGATGVLLLNESLQEHFDVGLNHNGEVLIDGATVKIGDRFLVLLVSGDQLTLVVRNLLTLGCVTSIAYDVTGTVNGGTVEGTRTEQFHFTPPAKILYLTEMWWGVLEEDPPTLELFEKDCEGFLVP